ncbi:DUF1517 domain-containing protein [Oscillatoria sp. FACHB-1406]|uniref:DUF1517 domain-containing protein n=1 Tax=Oscillatoria sp. FACHB-1406 TaxID=2692846 RepID=UPI001683FBD5|nr:DUF1517 domain-containing protein [Oscillatoria sp. FACHB-1406]MBD2578719.1 DUF1517 domain-containing protein [Oscillatoria sp. FACHB-1406]
MLNKVKIRYIFATLCSLAVLNAVDLSFPVDNANFQLQTQAQAKKSGGTSGGGSFRSSPSSSSRSSSSSSKSSSSSSRSSSPSPKRDSSPSRSRSNQRERTAPSTYRPPIVVPRTVTPQRTQPSSTYRAPVYAPSQPPVYAPPASSTYYPPSRESVEYRTYSVPSSNGGDVRGTPTTSNEVYINDTSGRDRIIILFALLGISIPLFLLLYFLFKKMGTGKGNGAVTAIEKERDNDTVTLSKLQVALLVTDSTIQEELSQLSLSVDTGTPEGRWELLQESLLILQRNSDVWTYAVSSSESTNIDTAETTFQQRCFEERSKFSRETLSNVEGEVKTRPVATLDEEIGAYVVVTLLLGTAEDKPLFGAIRSTDELKDAIAKLAAMRSDYLMTFYLFWTPQQAGQGLSDEEMITEYTNLYRLA